MTLIREEPSSFRDPTAQVVYHDGAVRRTLRPEALAAWEALSGTRFYARWIRDGRLVPTDRVPGQPMLEHQRIPFVSYPACWSFRMLQDAALLQLDLMLDALDEGFTCKDATPYNVQFVGARPVFIDVPSLVPLCPGPWRPFRQFCESYLYPLMLSSWKGVPFQPWLRGSVDGLPTSVAARLLSVRDLLRPGALSHVLLPAMLGTAMPGEALEGAFEAGFLRRNIRRLRSLVAGLRPPRSASTWLGYAACCHYEEGDRAVKRDFVERVVAARSWQMAWDVGANRGEYSRMASPHAGTVLALDADADVVDALYAELRGGGPGNVLPLVQDVADPSAARGWRGRERMSLEQRGRPDLVLMLAVVHHLAITRSIPLREILAWLADLGAEAVVELPLPSDPRVLELMRASPVPDYSQADFEDALGGRLDVAERVVLPSSTRILYHLKPVS